MKKSVSPTIQLSLMVEPAVHKYLVRTHPGIYVVNASHMLGSFILLSLARKGVSQRIDLDGSYFKKYGKMLTNEYKFILPKSYFDRIGTHIPIQRMFQLNDFVLDLMYTELMMNIVYGHGLKGEEMIQRCIDNFRSKYDIYEKELPDERLRKKYLRMRQDYDNSADFAKVFNPGELLWKMR